MGRNISSKFLGIVIEQQTKRWSFFLFYIPLLQIIPINEGLTCVGDELYRNDYRFLGVRLWKGRIRVRRQCIQMFISNQLERKLGEVLCLDPHIITKLQTLMQGLDSESVQTINRILARAKYSYLTKQTLTFNLTQEEQNQIYRIQREFYPNIIKFADDAYFYNGYWVSSSHLEVGVFWHKHSMHLFKHLDKIAQGHILDVGGFTGDSAIVLQEYTNKKVYTFEATQGNFQKILRTIELNKSNKIIPIQKALGSKTEKIYINLNGSASSFVAHHGNDSEEVEVITLDSYIAEHNIQVSLIKVDIEGFEMEFLKGAKQTIVQQKPAMILSIYHSPSDFLEIKPLIESWNLGYRFKIHKAVDETSLIEVALYCEVD
ncbi:hypothetical protein CCZ01_03025 [Helicobacter monodelphidis]|uniref:FkbM family methyltransferase n=1 Tax=Helicobacter sp. 15-1451 TaxID=2004995 RepID=UPI000DCC231B|nr:FkbM family methyltransferase [Helicobacter sp. 15-1451]RAX58404.1 hypothetical protein CCZ01_03025 [Helicobacter sp. 15-1451]